MPFEVYLGCKLRLEGRPIPVEPAAEVLPGIWRCERGELQLYTALRALQAAKKIRGTINKLSMVLPTPIPNVVAIHYWRGAVVAYTLRGEAYVVETEKVLGRPRRYRLAVWGWPEERLWAVLEGPATLYVPRSPLLPVILA